MRIYPNKKIRKPIHGLYIFDIDCSIHNDDITTQAYNCWSRMISRCHDTKYQDRCETYKDCSVCKEWYLFSNFFSWFKQNYKQGCELDKDILVKGNKVYSPDTCCFVPQEINKILIKRNKKRGTLPIGVYEQKSGVFLAQIHKNAKTYTIGTFNNPNSAFLAYKNEKEKYIKEKAKEYFEKGLINENVFIALTNYKVNIND